MIVVEFTLDHPILRRALQREPGTKIVWERSDAVDGDRVRLLVWAESDEFETFERAAEEDPTVESLSVVATAGSRRLYQTELRGEGLATSIYPLVVEEGGVIHELTATHDGWQFRAEFPDRESFARCHAFCRERDVDFEFHRLFEERETASVDEYGLTDEQRETLLAAVSSGYLEIPREQSLSELADELGISGNAASERFRRAVKTLVENALSPVDERKRASDGRPEQERSPAS
ncbi:helix-turn-helix domain-containing protein [Haloprofundus halophilus]|uniref:helix-turn-helix domain-containing protein n=1 Tax=Haloprofundus halophilus TaxID=2283527 RepID=UPI000E444861|nr:helix-turn-helix domain-containing protein [Haloprofundus halophilus]